MGDYLSDGALGRTVRAGSLVRLWHGAYALPHTAGEVATRLAAAELTLGRAPVAAHHTAAELFGFGVENDHRTHVLAEANWASRRGNLVLHRNMQTVPPVMVGTHTVTDPAETVLTLASAQSSGQRALGLLDASLRSGSVTPERLAQQAVWLSINGIRRVRALIPFADGRAESPPESWLRWVFLDAGLPVPTPQLTVVSKQGLRYRLDLGWEEYQVGCEYDGVEFHTGAALSKDRRRLTDLAELGWVLAHATGAMVWQGRLRLAETVRQLLRSRGCPC